jgi:hypothetical protein
VNELIDRGEVDAELLPIRGLPDRVEHGLGRIMRRGWHLQRPNEAAGRILDDEIGECPADIDTQSIHLSLHVTSISACIGHQPRRSTCHAHARRWTAGQVQLSLPDPLRRLNRN